LIGWRSTAINFETRAGTSNAVVLEDVIAMISLLT